MCWSTWQRHFSLLPPYVCIVFTITISSTRCHFSFHPSFRRSTHQRSRSSYRVISNYSWQIFNRRALHQIYYSFRRFLRPDFDEKKKISSDLWRLWRLIEKCKFSCEKKRNEEGRKREKKNRRVDRTEPRRLVYEIALLLNRIEIRSISGLLCRQWRRDINLEAKLARGGTKPWHREITVIIGLHLRRGDLCDVDRGTFHGEPEIVKKNVKTGGRW